MNIQIIIATHKKTELPKDTLYLPVFVGSHGKEDIGYQRDDEGENISEKNPLYCELTGLYWAWKNLKSDYVGLVHYRRYLSGTEKIRQLGADKLKYVLKREKLEKELQKFDLILPTKRNYLISSIYDHYKDTHYEEHLVKTRQVIEEQCPEYLEEFDRLKKRRSAHMFNIFVMKRELLNDYCSFLFPILFEIEKQIDTSGYSAFQLRYPGRISELLFDVWMYKNKIPYKELPWVQIGKSNFIKKALNFTKSKIKGKQYEKSM